MMPFTKPEQAALDSYDKLYAYFVQTPNYDPPLAQRAAASLAAAVHVAEAVNSLDYTVDLIRQYGTN